MRYRIILSIPLIFFTCGCAGTQISASVSYNTANTSVTIFANR
jgi:hypothetical protein